MPPPLVRRLPPPPDKFRPVEDVLWVEHSLTPPPFIAMKVRENVRGRRADGIKYEKRVQEWLRRTRSNTYVASPWFHFSSIAFQDRWCQPDGLDLDVNRGVATVVEIKLQHTAKAWWQLRSLYEPVVTEWLGKNWSVAILEVCKWFDPDVAFPERVRFTSNCSAAVGPFNVQIWS